MKLVEDVKQAWHWFSMWLIGANATFIVAYEQMDTLKGYIPDKYAHYAIVTLLVLTALGRVVKQGESSPAP